MKNTSATSAAHPTESFEKVENKTLIYLNVLHIYIIVFWSMAALEIDILQRNSMQGISPEILKFDGMNRKVCDALRRCHQYHLCTNTFSPEYTEELCTWQKSPLLRDKATQACLPRANVAHYVH